jgi:hypothetical protein
MLAKTKILQNEDFVHRRPQACKSFPMFADFAP